MSWTPHTDVVVGETGEILLRLQLVGWMPDELELLTDGLRLLVRGHHNLPVGISFLPEMADPTFEVIYEIPPLYNLGEARATYEPGILNIQIPRRGDI